MGPAHRAVKCPQLAVLPDGRPRSLDEFPSQPALARAGDRASIGVRAGGALAGHHAQKPGQLADVAQFPPIPDPGNQLTGHDPSNPWNRPQQRDAPGQLWVTLTVAADLAGRFQDLLFTKSHTVGATDPA